jgi:hypothetical protein
VVRVKAQRLSLAVLLCFYVIFAFSINPFMDDFLGTSIEVTDQKNEGVFSSLSRNFDQTVEEINSADEKSTSSTSSTDSNSADEKSTSSTSSTDSSNSADEKSTASNVPIAAIESSNLISSNSTTTHDLGKNNQTDFDK